MKKVKLTFEAFKKLVNKLRECKKANKALNAQIKRYNDKFNK